MQIRNSVQLIGNLGNDPQQYNSKDGTPFVKFSLATNDYYKDKEGNRQTRTEWHTIVAFGKKGEYVMDSLKKGSKIAINGVLRYRSWTDKHEQKRTDATIHLEQYTKLNSDNSSQSE
ncbi:MAG: single-stranded DNA-binding protein [Bacteroidota bacterium]